MSLGRFVYYSAVIGGWAAFLAWLLAEALVLHGGSDFPTLVVVGVAALVGATIAAGLNLVSGMTNAQWRRQLARLPSGLLGGGIGGAVGGLLGNLATLATESSLGQVLGWMLMGLAIGLAGGIEEKSRRKCRNGALGGALGGLLGGLLFQTVAAGSSMAARATAFVILGAAIGALVGLAQLVLKEAWLTVVDGFRPGRELILGQTVTILGRGDHLPLPFLGYPGRDLDAEHARITRQPDGVFVLEDNGSRLGTRLNGQPVQTATPLKDGDLIKLGTNLVRFNSRQWGWLRAAAAMAVRPTAFPAGGSGLPPLPPPPKPLVPAVPTGMGPPLPPAPLSPPAPPAPAVAPFAPAPQTPASPPPASETPPAPPILPGGAVPPPPPRRWPAGPRIPPPPPPPRGGTQR
jgi:hypothetical protein